MYAYILQDKYHVDCFSKNFYVKLEPDLAGQRYLEKY